MQDVYEVLREKEIAMERVRREIEAMRSVLHLLIDESDSTPITLESGISEEKADVVSSAGEGEDAIARIPMRFVDAGRKGIMEGTGRSVLLQFKDIVLGVLRTFLKRVLDSPLFERKPQRKTIHHVSERLERSNAA
jgi:hypothetical protein